MRKIRYEKDKSVQISDLLRARRNLEDRFAEFDVEIKDIIKLVAPELPVDFLASALKPEFTKGAYLKDGVKAPVNATATLTMANLPKDGETITIGDEVYTFSPSPTLPEAPEGGDPIEPTPLADFVVEIGETIGETQTNLITEIEKLTDLVTIGTFAQDAVVITCKTPGALKIATTSTLSAEGDGFGAETTADGVDGTVAIQGEILFNETSVWFCYKDSTAEEGYFKSISFGA